jgi:hypothetical protein
LLALLRKPPAAFGWCRTRWSCATLALSLEVRRGVGVSAETVRRWWQRLGWRWKRSKLIAKDNDPQRATKLASIRLALETLGPRQALLFVEELDIQLWPKAGYQWMPKGTQTEVLTPGQNEKPYLAGGWDVRTGVMHSCFALTSTLLGPPSTPPPLRHGAPFSRPSVSSDEARQIGYKADLERKGDRNVQRILLRSRTIRKLKLGCRYDVAISVK